MLPINHSNQPQSLNSLYEISLQSIVRGNGDRIQKICKCYLEQSAGYHVPLSITLDILNRLPQAAITPEILLALESVSIGDDHDDIIDSKFWKYCCSREFPESKITVNSKKKFVALKDLEAIVAALKSIDSQQKEISGYAEITKNLNVIKDLPITVALLQSTGAGKVLNSFMKTHNSSSCKEILKLVAHCKSLLIKWKQDVSLESSAASSSSSKIGSAMASSSPSTTNTTDADGKKRKLAHINSDSNSNFQCNNNIFDSNDAVDNADANSTWKNLYHHLVKAREERFSKVSEKVKKNLVTLTNSRTSTVLLKPVKNKLGKVVFTKVSPGGGSGASKSIYPNPRNNSTAKNSLTSSNIGSNSNSNINNKSYSSSTNRSVIYKDPSELRQKS